MTESHFHEHDDDEHGAHSAEPLAGVDAGPLHDAVAMLAAALHTYVDTAVGVRAEFGSQEADEDPRVLAVEAEIGSLNARLYDALHETLGLHADLTGMSWDDGEEGDADAPPSAIQADTFHLGFVVGPPTGTSDLSLDGVLDLVDASGAEIAQQLVDAGYEVAEWGVSRGGPVLFGDEDDEDDEDGYDDGPDEDGER
ncbi:MAG: hypothetical protein ABUS54_07030 [Actinomycetota bacterium]